MDIKDKIERLENKFDKFVHDFYNELTSLKGEVKEKHPTVYERMCKIVCNAKSMKIDIIKFTISKDMERELRKSFLIGSEPSYGISTFMGIPVEIDLTCYNTITATIK